MFKHFSDIFREAYTPEQSASLLADAIVKRYGRSSFDVLCATLEGKTQATALGRREAILQILAEILAKEFVKRARFPSWASLLNEFM